MRGSIDLVERHRKTGFLRVTDHKTGKNRTTAGQTVVDGGRVLQPVVYGLALEALLEGQTVFSGRLSFCTSTGGFTQYEIPLLANARRAGARSARDHRSRRSNAARSRRVRRRTPARYCDFEVVCGRQEERRTGRKARELFEDLIALREMP